MSETLRVESPIGGTPVGAQGAIIPFDPTSSTSSMASSRGIPPARVLRTTSSYLQLRAKSFGAGSPQPEGGGSGESPQLLGSTRSAAGESLRGSAMLNASLANSQLTPAGNASTEGSGVLWSSDSRPASGNPGKDGPTSGDALERDGPASGDDRPASGSRPVTSASGSSRASRAGSPPLAGSHPLTASEEELRERAVSPDDMGDVVQRLARDVALLKELDRAAGKAPSPAIGQAVRMLSRQISNQIQAMAQTAELTDQGEAAGEFLRRLKSGESIEDVEGWQSALSLAWVSFNEEGDERQEYLGQQLAGVTKGLGILLFRDGATYEGEWLHDTFHGFGLESFPDGSSYAGEFKEGVRCGVGVLTGADGIQYAGGWEDGVQHGDGIISSLLEGEKHASFKKGKMGDVKPGGIAALDYPFAANSAAAAAKEAMVAMEAARLVAADVRRTHVEDETLRDKAVIAVTRAANGLSLEELARAILPLQAGGERKRVAFRAWVGLVEARLEDAAGRGGDEGEGGDSDDEGFRWEGYEDWDLFLNPDVSLAARGWADLALLSRRVQRASNDVWRADAIAAAKRTAITRIPSNLEGDASEAGAALLEQVQAEREVERKKARQRGAQGRAEEKRQECSAIEGRIRGTYAAAALLEAQEQRRKAELVALLVGQREAAKMLRLKEIALRAAGHWKGWANARSLERKRVIAERARGGAEAVQRNYRMHFARRTVVRRRAARVVQCNWRMRRARKARANERVPADERLRERVARQKELDEYGGASGEFETDWVFLTATGWREDLVFTVLRHRTLGTVVELGHNQGRSFLFKVGNSGSTPASTPGNTPRHQDKVKMCRDDGYFADWRFNSSDLVRRLEAGEGKRLQALERAGVWTLRKTDPHVTAHKVFSRYDGDGSGSIDESELLPAAKEMGFVVVEEDLSKLVAEIDQDGNGEIDFREFCLLLQIDEAKPNMIIRSSESSAEMWLTPNGFIYLAVTEKVDAIVAIGGFCPPYTVDKAAAWMHLGRVDSAAKRIQWNQQQEEMRIAKEEAAQQELMAESMAKEKKDSFKEAKEERRRQRIAGTYTGADSQPLLPNATV